MVEHDGRPPAARPEDVTIGEAAARRESREAVERPAPGDEIGHVDVDRVEAHPVECGRKLHVPVYPLLAEDRDGGSGEWRARSGAGREREARAEPRVVGVEKGVERLLRAVGVVAKSLHPVARLRPVPVKIGARGVEHHRSPMPEAEPPARVRLPDRVDVRREAGDRAQPLQHRPGIAGAHLQHRAQLFGEEHAQGLRAERGEIDAKAGPSGERHLAESRGKAAVRAVVVGEHEAVADEGLHRVEEFAQHVRLRIGCNASRQIEDLGEGGAAEPAAAESEVRKQQAVGHVTDRHGGQDLPNVGDRCECGHDEREGGAHRALAPIVGPRGAHGEAVLADRDREPEGRAELPPCRPNRVMQRGVVGSGVRHPVRRQDDGRQLPDPGRGEIGEGFADGHAGRGGGVENGEGRALAHRHRLPRTAPMVGGDGRTVGDRNLPRPYHLIAGGQPRDGAVADGDEERLVRDARQPQHPLQGRGGLEAGGKGDLARQGARRPWVVACLAREARRVPEDEVDGHVHRRRAMQVVSKLDPGFLRHRANDGERAAFAPADRFQPGPVVRGDDEDVALLGLVAPELLHRAHARIGSGDRAEVDPRSALVGRGPAPGWRWRVRLPPRRGGREGGCVPRAGCRPLMTSWARRCISALSRWTDAKSSARRWERAGMAVAPLPAPALPLPEPAPAPAPLPARASETPSTPAPREEVEDAAPPPTPISIAGPPSTPIRVPGGSAALVA